MAVNMTMISTSHSGLKLTNTEENTLNKPKQDARQSVGNIVNFVKKTLKVKNIITGLTLAYLIMLLIPTKLGGPVIQDNQKLGLNELGLFTLVLLADSGILERVKEFKFGKDGVEFQVDIQNNVAANRSASQREAAALTYLGRLIQNDEEQRQFFDILIDDGERDLLEHLFEAERANNEYPYEKTEKLQEHLRHLRSLQLIAPKAEVSISSMPDQDNLRKYFQVTDWGKFCLDSGSSEVILEAKEIHPRYRKMLQKKAFKQLEGKA